MNLLIETSGRGGLVGLVQGDNVVGAAVLNEARRHARDLAEQVRILCTAAKIRPAEIQRVIVGIGPGSYTGLRVGIASAKAFAYATACELVAVPTFSAIAAAMPPKDAPVDVAADALQGQVYVQRFRFTEGAWRPCTELKIVTAAEYDWAASVVGPWNAQPPTAPTLESLGIAARDFAPLAKSELFALEPLYLRGSSAEERRTKRVS